MRKRFLQMHSIITNCFRQRSNTHLLMIYSLFRKTPKVFFRYFVREVTAYEQLVRFLIIWPPRAMQGTEAGGSLTRRTRRAAAPLAGFQAVRASMLRHAQPHCGRKAGSPSHPLLCRRRRSAARYDVRALRGDACNSSPGFGRPGEHRSKKSGSDVHAVTSDCVVLSMPPCRRRAIRPLSARPVSPPPAPPSPPHRPACAR